MDTRPQVVLLNGIGSVGKSSTAKAIQAMASQPFLHVAMDGFLDMLPEAMLAHPDGLRFEATERDGKPVITVRSGPVLDRAMQGMRHAVAAMAGAGNNLIVDEVILDPRKALQYRELLRFCDLYVIGLLAPLDVLEARERARGDRRIGLARGQYGRVHRDMDYDLQIDTATASPTACARLICDTFRL
ncbi:MAG: chloramphenicol phosphotransferase [Rhodospirillales bacterium]|nr:chloramphenicol phosphotransferase [Rhodospirillales bacterium]